MAATPIERVRYLLGDKHNPTHTPATLSGGPTGIYSYRLLIAFKDGDDLLVTTERNSPTTNRHIQACHRTATMAVGLHDVGTETINGREWKRYQRY